MMSLSERMTRQLETLAAMAADRSKRYMSRQKIIAGARALGYEPPQQRSYDSALAELEAAGLVQRSDELRRVELSPGGKSIVATVPAWKINAAGRRALAEMLDREAADG